MVVRGFEHQTRRHQSRLNRPGNPFVGAPDRVAGRKSLSRKAELGSSNPLLGKGVEIVVAVGSIGSATRPFASQMKLPQPLARLAEIRGSTALIGAATPSATGTLFETLHALAQVINFGLDNFGGHIFDLREFADAEIEVGADLTPPVAPGWPPWRRGVCVRFDEGVCAGVCGGLWER